MSVAEIRKAIENWSEFDRGSLAAWLLESLPPHSAGDASAEGIQEAARRRAELDSGHVQSLRSDEFWASIDQLRSTWK
jgi:hypothetical protein